MADDEQAAFTGSGERQHETVRVRAVGNLFGLTTGQEGELVRDRDVEMALHLGELEEVEVRKRRKRASG